MNNNIAKTKRPFYLIITVLIIISLTLPVLVDSLQHRNYFNDIEKIKIGDDLNTVTKIMGSPISKHPHGTVNFKAKNNNLAYVYGAYFDLENAFLKEAPYFYPFKIRLFGAEPGDIVIEFNAKNKVVEIIK